MASLFSTYFGTIPAMHLPVEGPLVDYSDTESECASEFASESSSESEPESTFEPPKLRRRTRVRAGKSSRRPKRASTRRVAGVRSEQRVIDGCRCQLVTWGDGSRSWEPRRVIEQVAPNRLI